MALIQCHECGKDISDTAAACPHCGAPVAGSNPTRVEVVQRRGSGCGWFIALALLALVLLYTIGSCNRRADTDALTGGKPLAAPADAPQNAAIRAAIVQDLMATGVPREVSWVRPTELWIVVVDNGKPWQQVADAACTNIRNRGMQGRVSVEVHDHFAVQNKRVDALARARCN